MSNRNFETRGDAAPVDAAMPVDAVEEALSHKPDYTTDSQEMSDIWNGYSEVRLPGVRKNK